MAKIDPVLENLVKQAFASDIGAGVTLLVNGAAISGTLISPARYLDEFAKIPGMSPENVANLRLEAGGVRGILDQVQDVLGSDELAFAYMFDAIISMGSQIIRLPIWRVRLESVDGWAFGGHKS